MYYTTCVLSAVLTLLGSKSSLTVKLSTTQEAAQLCSRPARSTTTRIGDELELLWLGTFAFQPCEHNTYSDGRIRVYRRRNERYTEACTLEQDRFGGGGSVMVWGGVSQHHRTELVVTAGNLNAVSYREDILLPHVVPFLQAHPDMTLQHDNATSHTARSVRDLLQDRNVSVLPWPAKSLDLNPIEHIWDLLDRRVRARAIPPRNARELAGVW
uniref:Tc1-like transposase DDE domain-containing protein n=1 Tax=Salmo trutta TaxID=8032 RepID=A0A674C3D8_SALTR